MKKLVVGVALISFLFSCKDSKEVKIQKAAKIVDSSTIKDSLPEDVVVSVEDFKNDFDILLPRGYRTYEGENPAGSITKNWIDLYEKNGEHYLEEADFTIEKGFDDCVGDSLKSIISKNKTIVFMDYPELKLGKIKSLKVAKNKIWPAEKVTFTFNKVSYILRAEGKVQSSEKVNTDDNTEDIFMDVKNYKLYLTAGKAEEKLLLEEESFNNTFVELLFVGDIDGDGKLDFIFSASRNYEEERVILFLSSKAKNGGVIKKVSEIAVQFDC